MRFLDLGVAMGATETGASGALFISILELGVRTRTLVTRKCNVITVL